MNERKKLIYSQEDLDLILSLELDKYKNVIDKLKKMINNHVIIETRGKGEISPYAITTRELEELLEEVDGE